MPDEKQNPDAIELLPGGKGVILAKTAGFCFGVKRAIEQTEKLIEDGVSPLVTLGSLIHNEIVTGELERKGVRAVSEDELDRLSPGTTVVIRSHGVGRSVYEKLSELSLNVQDATCPFVRKIHKIVEKESENGRYILIIGDNAHPEVKGICGWCRGPYTVLNTAAEAENFILPIGQKFCVVSQTTFNDNKFKEIVEILIKKSYSKDVLGIFNISNTICSATEERQAEARKVSASVDTMLVVGSRQSSNTQKLFEICKNECKNTYYIQTPVDLDSEMFHCSSYVGITAGASTPKKIIEEVLEHVRTEL